MFITYLEAIDEDANGEWPACGIASTAANDWCGSIHGQLYCLCSALRNCSSRLNEVSYGGCTVWPVLGNVSDRRSWGWCYRQVTDMPSSVTMFSQSQHEGLTACPRSHYEVLKAVCIAYSFKSLTVQEPVTRDIHAPERYRPSTGLTCGIRHLHICRLLFKARTCSDMHTRDHVEIHYGDVLRVVSHAKCGVAAMSKATVGTC